MAERKKGSSIFFLAFCPRILSWCFSENKLDSERWGRYSTTTPSCGRGREGGGGGGGEWEEKMETEKEGRKKKMCKGRNEQEEEEEEAEE